MSSLYLSRSFSGIVFFAVGTLAACSPGQSGSSSIPEPVSGDDSHGTPPVAEIPFRPVSWGSSKRLLGRVPAGEELSLQVHLRMRDEKAAEAELAAIQDPRSPSFGHFLSTEEFEDKYAPTEEDVDELTDYLEGHGMQVSHVPDNRAYVAVEGTARQVEAAFGTRLGVFETSGEEVSGEPGRAKRHAPMDPPKLPAHLASLVLEVVGLSTTPHVKSHLARRIEARGASLSPDAAGAPTCSQWFGQVADTEDPPYGPSWPALTFAPCGHKPAQVRRAYGFADAVRSGNDGTGVTIAIVDAFQSPTLLQDAQTYAAQSDPDHPLKDDQLWTLMAPGKESTPDTNWYAEQTLDVEAVHAMAPGANIVYVGAQSATHADMIAAVNLIVSRKLATIVSNSYGSMEIFGGLPYSAWHSIATQAGLKGIGLYFSSGDSGDNSLGFGLPPTTDMPASLDNVTAVGGTSLALDSTGAPMFEVGWETGSSTLLPQGQPEDPPPAWEPVAPGTFLYGSGGGTSKVYEQPQFQAGVVPPALANVPGAPSRVVPDVAMLGDPATGFVIGQTVDGAYSEQAIGGTSLSCPLFAAVMALAEQRAGHPIGFANPMLYQARGREAYRDIVPGASPQAVTVRTGRVVTLDFPGLTIRTAAGYDNVTGLGVPNGQSFLDALH